VHAKQRQGRKRHVPAAMTEPSGDTCGVNSVSERVVAPEEPRRFEKHAIKAACDRMQANGDLITVLVASAAGGIATSDSNGSPPSSRSVRDAWDQPVRVTSLELATALGLDPTSAGLPVDDAASVHNLKRSCGHGPNDPAERYRRTHIDYALLMREANTRPTSVGSRDPLPKPSALPKSLAPSSASIRSSAKDSKGGGVKAKGGLKEGKGSGVTRDDVSVVDAFMAPPTVMAMGSAPAAVAAPAAAATPSDRVAAGAAPPGAKLLRTAHAAAPSARHAADVVGSGALRRHQEGRQTRALS